MKRLGSRPDLVAALLTRLRPLPDRARAAVAVAARALAARVSATVAPARAIRSRTEITASDAAGIVEAPIDTPIRLAPEVREDGGNDAAADETRAGEAVVSARPPSWTAAWRRWREDPRPATQKLGEAFDGVLSAPAILPLRERLWKLWTWAVLHDTAPREATARRREWSMARQHRKEERESDRLHRREEQAKKREKKDEEERQAYSVYFE